MYSFSKKERWALAGLTVLLLPALLVNLGMVPLYVEEPRRATVALEMLLRGNWLVPTINGEFYYLKPPLFNWILAGIYYFAGGPTELLTRIPTVVSLLLLGLVIFWSGKKYVSADFGALSALLFVTAAGNLYFNALLAEIDIFYSLVTYSGMILLFYFHQKKSYLLLFLSVYFLGAIGILTKGLPSLVFTGWSLLVFFLVNKDFRKLFTWQHLAGILIFLVLTFGYFIVYSRHGDAVKYLMNLSVESGKRLSGDTFLDYIGHLLLYPLDTLMNLLPASLLLIFAARRSFLKDVRSNTFMRFALLMLLAHFPVYWFPPGGRQRYIIMLYPFMVQLFVYFYLIYFYKEKERFRLFSVLILVATGLGAIGSLVPLLVGSMQTVPLLIPVCLVSFVLMAALFFLQLKNPSWSVINLLAAVILLRIFFGMTVLPVRATEGVAPANKLAAAEIIKTAGKRDVCILDPTYLPMQTIFYYEKEKLEILPRCNTMQPGKVLITEKFILAEYHFRKETSEMMINPVKPVSDRLSREDQRIIPGRDYEIISELTLQKRNYLLITLN